MMTAIFDKKLSPMDTLIIEIRNPKVRALLDTLAEMELIAIVPDQSAWREEWKNLSGTLPEAGDVSDEEIPDEGKDLRADS